MSSRRRGRLNLWRRRRSDAAIRCAVEALESRTLLSTTLTVSSLADSGTGSLRAEITAANGDTGPITINFGGGLSGSIDLASELPTITSSGDVTIDGPGASQITVNGEGFGAVFTDQGMTLEIENLTITGGGTTNDPGSGVVNNQGTLTLANTTITGNKATDGGGVFNNGGWVYITDSIISNNSSISVPATLTGGGGVYNSDTGVVTITGSTIEDNTAALIGGGISNEGNLSISSSTVSDNSAADGGGIFSGGTLTVVQSTFNSNSTSAGNGAAIDNTGVLSVTGSTIDGNVSVGNGGGIYSYYSGTGAILTITNSTIVANTAIDGGGIDEAGPFDFGSATVLATLTDCTISGNTASGTGGGIYYRYAGSHVNTVTIDGSIVAANNGGDMSSSSSRAVFTGSYDLIGDGSDSSLLTHSQLGSSGDLLNPDLVALANNGGPTQTTALAAGSPAIGNGAVFAAAGGVDQRGDARTSGSVDIGAYQTPGNPNLTNPVVTTNPVSQSIPAGQTVTFTVAATGNPTPTVQWQLSTNSGSSFSNISGATSTTYSFTTASGENGYEYRAVFTNSQSTATTTAAILTVTAALAPPVVTTNPVSQSIPAGQTVTFTAAATGNPTATVQWQVSTNSGSSFSNISGATSTTYSFTTTSGENGYEYRAVFTNSQNTANTSAATLTVTAALAGPVVTTNPVSQSIPAGQTVTFIAAATGNPSPTVQWQVSTNGGSSFSNISGATSTTYSFTTTSGENGYEYQAVFTNSQNSATTTAATLTVTAALVGPTITTNPISQSIPAGQTVTFVAAATGNPMPTVQWQVSTNGGSSFSNISGATSTTYSFTTTSGENGYEYQAVFTNSQNTATTTAATLTVTAALVGPTVTTNPVSQSIPAGQTVTFTAAATGNPSPTVQWQVSTNGGSSFSNINGANSTTYTFTTTSGENGYEYRAVFTNSQNTATTMAATLTVTAALAAPVVTTNPVSQSIPAGQTVTFTAAATGNPSPTVQWQISTNGGSSFSNIVGATSTTYSFTTTSGENGYEYQAVFTNSQNTATTTAATLTVTAALVGPAITTNPVSQSIPAGQTVTFTAAATGNPSPTVQWQISTNGGSSFSNIVGAITTSYSFTTSSGENGYEYRAVFTNSQNTATTTAATLTVTAALAGPVVTTNPVNQSIPAGQTVTFTAAATGNPSPTVQWQISTNGGSSFSNIVGAITTSYGFTTSSGENGYEYQAVFTNSQNTATTNAATLTVTAALAGPVVTTNPVSQSIPAGQTVTFTAAATGNPSPTVQWYLSTDGGETFSPIEGATSTSYGFATTSGENGYEYQAVFTNSQNTATTTAATLTVTMDPTAPVITTDPVSQSVPAGQTVTFTAAATGSPSPTVQWYVSTDGGGTFSPIEGATSTTYSFTTTSEQDGYEYQAVFTNSQNSATTTAATLTVTAALAGPAITTDPVSQSIPAEQTVTFTAAATGNPTPTVQWYLSTNGGDTFNPIEGATSTTYSFTTTSGQNGYEYEAVFTNSQNTATTPAATLTVTAALAGPVVTANPTSQTIQGGQTVTFTTAATGNPTPTVQWYLSTDGGETFNSIEGATSTTYSFTTSVGQYGYEYEAVFTNSQNTATTTAATLTVLAAPVVAIDPVSHSVPSGQTASFTAAASGGPLPSVQWQISTNGGKTFTNITGATSTTYSFMAATSKNNDEFRAVFTNSQGTATTTGAKLTVTAALTVPVVKTKPTSHSVKAGLSVTFTATATGNPAPTVQWQVSTNGGASYTNIVGATSTSLSFTTSFGENGDMYRAVFTNSQGTATTTAATLTVLAAPVITANPQSADISLGHSVTFTAGAIGNKSPTVQWYVSTNGGGTFKKISGATSATYSFTPTMSQNGDVYRAVFTNPEGSATTAAVILTM